jgi:transcriptional regulator with XRE-family HTH domain
MKTIHERIRHLRSILGLEQAEMAKLIGVSRGAVGNWELRGGIKQANLRRLADLTGVSFEWLATGKGPAPQHKSDLAPEDRHLALTPIKLKKSQIIIDRDVAEVTFVEVLKVLCPEHDLELLDLGGRLTVAILEQQQENSDESRNFDKIRSDISSTAKTLLRLRRPLS